MLQNTKRHLINLIAAVVVILVVFGMSGCTAIGQLVDTASDANDKALVTAEFTVCRGASVGSVLRRYNTPELAAIWQDLCLRNTDNLLSPTIP